MSSPPIVSSPVTSRRSSEITTFSSAFGSEVGLAREMPMCEPPRKWMRLTRVDGERRDVFDVPVHQPLEAVADADDVHAFEGGADGGGADDAVDAGSGTAAHQDGEFFVMFHARPLLRPPL